MRSAWFKKPFALLQTPFEVTCWIDLDCAIKGCLEPLFNSLGDVAQIALVRELEETQDKDLEQQYIFPGEVSYNSGVIVFRREAEVVHLWVEAALKQNDRFMSDQGVLSRVIFLYDIPLVELPSIYNWFRILGLNSEAVIIHYSQSWKLEILKSLQPSLFLDEKIEAF